MNELAINPNDFLALLNLVAAIDQHLRRDTRHFYTSAGHRLTELDQVIRAILSDDLIFPPSGGLGGLTPTKPVPHPYTEVDLLSHGWPMFPEEV